MDMLSIIVLEPMQVEYRHDGILCLELNGGWNYPSVNYIWKRVYTELEPRGDLEGEQCNRTLDNLNLWGYVRYGDSLYVFAGGQPIKAVVIDCACMSEIDYTTVQVHIHV